MSFGADFYADFLHTDTMDFLYTKMSVLDGKNCPNKKAQRK